MARMRRSERVFLVINATAASMMWFAVFMFMASSPTPSPGAGRSPVGINDLTKERLRRRCDTTECGDAKADNGVGLYLPGLAHGDVELVYRRFLEADSAAAFEAQGTASPLVVVEAGATPNQCTLAATLGYTTHCFEPSPKSYQRLKMRKRELETEVGARLVLHSEAASEMAGMTRPFRSTKGPGDHVGEYDMWRMERNMSENESANPKSGDIIQVKTAKLDDVVEDLNAEQRQWKVHLLRVETSGHEAHVFAGLKSSLKAGAVKYIIFQFWPRALDLMKATEGTCLAGAGVINNLLEAGYRLHAMQVMSHPRAPISVRKDMWEEEKTRPAGPLTADTSQSYCQWFLDIEGRHPSKSGNEEYKFGYWSHFVAVAPGAELPAEVLYAHQSWVQKKSTATIATPVKQQENQHNRENGKNREGGVVYVIPQVDKSGSSTLRDMFNNRGEWYNSSRMDNPGVAREIRRKCGNWNREIRRKCGNWNAEPTNNNLTTACPRYYPFIPEPLFSTIPFFWMLHDPNHDARNDLECFNTVIDSAWKFWQAAVEAKNASGGTSSSAGKRRHPKPVIQTSNPCPPPGTPATANVECRRLVQMRHPLTWIESSFDYFCERCGDSNKFCGNPFNARCGWNHTIEGDHETIQSWARKFGNIFTRILHGDARLVSGGTYLANMSSDGWTYHILELPKHVDEVLQTVKEERHCIVALEDPHKLSKIEACLGDQPGFYNKELGYTEKTAANKRNNKRPLLDPNVTAELREILAADISLYNALFPFLADVDV